eukprot:11564944-Alexandrium_andersonii.AAC.1
MSSTYRTMPSTLWGWIPSASRPSALLRGASACHLDSAAPGSKVAARRLTRPPIGTPPCCVQS